MELGISAASKFRVACRDGKLDEVNAMLSKNTTLDVNARNDSNGFTGLIYAAERGHVDVVRSLLSHPKVAVNASDNHGNTPFSHACSKGHAGVVKLFLDDERTACNTRNTHGQTGFWLACAGNHTATIEILLSYTTRVDPFIPSLDGRPPTAVGNQNTRKRVEDHIAAGLAGSGGSAHTAVTRAQSLPVTLLAADALDPRRMPQSALTLQELAKASQSAPTFALRTSRKEMLAKMEAELRSKKAAAAAGPSLTTAVANNSANNVNVNVQGSSAPMVTQSPIEAFSNVGGLPSPSSPSFINKLRVSASDISYDPNAIVGEGSFGIVYAGLLKKATRVAVKVLRRTDAKTRTMFLSEISVMDGLTQRNIMPLMAFCEEPPMLITELVTGGNMRDRLQSLNWDQTKGLQYLHDVAEGMTYLHSFNVLHGDLKAPNVLIDRDVAKITDFGLARVREHTSVISGTHAGAGTAGYMAPEVYAGKGRKPADVFAFAMMCFETVSRGLRPYQGSNAFAIMGAVTRGERPARPADVVDRYWELIERAWDQDPSVRPTFPQIRDEIDSWK